MVKEIYVNLPVKDLAKSKEFFEKIGWSFNKDFSDDTAAALVIGNNIYAMLITEPKFKEFTKKQIADSNTTKEALIAVSVDSKEEVDAIYEKAIAAGAVPAMDPKEVSFMHYKTFEDLDHHHWEVLYIDPTQLQNPS